MIRKKKKMVKTHAIINTSKHQLSMQRYEPSTTAHVVRKLLTAVVTFRITIPNRPSVITLFGCFRCLDFRIKDLLLYMENPLYLCITNGPWYWFIFRLSSPVNNQAAYINSGLKHTLNSKKKRACGTCHINSYTTYIFKNHPVNIYLQTIRLLQWFPTICNTSRQDISFLHTGY
jgi:hypothetical protein